MNKVNYQIVMEKIISEHQLKNEVPKLLLHSCCAPCSSYCIELLSQYFEVTVFYYNPNIYPEEEYFYRAKEQMRFIEEFDTKYDVKFLEGEFDTKKFYDISKGLENAKEGQERCFKCYKLRLEETAKIAKELGFDYFTTTLSISPLKNSQKLNQIGAELENKYGIKYLFSDFKKKNGYKRSTEISKEFDMYRQYYCGCVYSKRDRDKEIELKNNQKIE
ncbi:epoxyqueuosine reductase QueH [Lachnobacterium bovis]|uniref:Epoxyqueuosine reductase QueH n=1 Tax=Lachnobacterium bovis TaxID=140626 RepID=A0A1H9PVN3_9FIRM|nr:epoxyqueuosine reductase QueH [Lachnobacterium bovis]SER52232.1 hypothetical protein SAMN02910429_00329 [Lachnobacterium bovis]